MNKFNIFEYGEKEISYLKKKDKKLGQAIDRIGMLEREIIPDKFTSLLTCIVSQQISNKAAETVWRRLRELLCEVTPEKVADAPLESIQKCGMSLKKAGYIKGIAEAVMSSGLDFKEFDSMTDDEIIKTLVKLKGVGVWTAEMLLIFSMQRPDVLSWDDFALRRGIMSLYGLKLITKEQFDLYKKRYSPCGTVAALYLWELSTEK